MGDELVPVKSVPPEQAVFAAALEGGTPEARATYLRAACGADVALCRRVEVLLRAAERAGDFLEVPPSELHPDADSNSWAAEFIEKAD